MKSDSEIIEDLGGATKVAALLGYDKQAGGVQRVHNWTTRGIPSQVKLDHPNLFLPAWVNTSINHELAEKEAPM